MPTQSIPTLGAREIRRVRSIALFRIVNDVNGSPRGLFELNDRHGDAIAYVERGDRFSSPSDVALFLREFRGETTWSEGPKYRLRSIDVEPKWLRDLRSTIADGITAPVVFLPSVEG